MRNQYPSNPQKFYLDRNPLEIYKYAAAGGIAPTNATRWQYDVPANRRCLINALMMFYRREVVWGTPGLVTVRIYVYKATFSHDILHWETSTNVADDKIYQNMGQGAILEPGDSIRFFTGDSGIGGTCSFWGTLLGTEFDV